MSNNFIICSVCNLDPPKKMNMKVRMVVSSIETVRNSLKVIKECGFLCTMT